MKQPEKYPVVTAPPALTLGEFLKLRGVECSSIPLSHSTSEITPSAMPTDKP